MLNIKIVGVNDSKSRRLKENVAQAVALCGGGIEMWGVDDVNEIISLGVKTIPALIIEDSIISEGVVLTTEQVAEIIIMRVIYSSKLANIQKITIPTDYSHTADTAFCYAYGLAATINASMALLHVCDNFVELGHKPSVNARLSIEEIALSELNGHLKKILSKHEALNHYATKPLLTTVVTKGQPEKAIVEASHNSDLVVMGTTGSSGLIEKLFGSISTHIAQKAYCPVLFVPPNVYFNGLSDILYVANFASPERAMLHQFLSFAQNFNSQTHFLHIKKQGGDQSLSAEKITADAVRQELAAQYAQTNPDNPFLYEEVTDDSLIDTINRYRTNHSIKLVVLATTGQKEGDALLHLHHTKKILLHTNTPLLILHVNDDMQLFPV